MSKKYIDIMDTTFRDGIESIYGKKVPLKQLLPAVHKAVQAGIDHFEIGSGLSFLTQINTFDENPFETMLHFRDAAGVEANLQYLVNSVSTVLPNVASLEMIELFAKLFAKYEITTIRNYDPLNDVRNLEALGTIVQQNGLMHELTLTIMDLPFGKSDIYNVEYYKEKILELLESGVGFDSIVFKDATGTSNAIKVFEVIKMARELLGEYVHIRYHTHESTGVSIACYLAALEAGVDGLDVAVAPVSGGVSQPDILALLNATKGMPYDFGNLDASRVLEYQEYLKDLLKNYPKDCERLKVCSYASFVPMPASQLLENIKHLRRDNTQELFNRATQELQEVIARGGYGISVAPLSQFYWEQAYLNALYGSWKKIATEYGKMILGYFGRTPIVPDPKIEELASKSLHLKPTIKAPYDIASKDIKNTIAYWRDILLSENLDIDNESILIAASSPKNGIKLLKNSI